MKLLFCIKCNEVFSLGLEPKECKGKHGGGVYIDNLNAEVWGPKESVFVLGFTNSSLAGALRDQLNLGDREPVYMPGYGVVPPGRDFTAFVIPNSAASVVRKLRQRV